MARDQVAIRVEGMGKRFYIGAARRRHDTLRDMLAEAALAPFRRMAGLLRGRASAASELSEEIWALRDVSFDVRRGEVVGIIGRNGAGKSTLLKILSRITDPTVGRALIHGRIGSLLEVGTGFHPELTGAENIFLNGAILGMTRRQIEQQFGRIVEFAEIDRFVDTPVKHYSSGMYTRLAFSVAAHLEPEILIVDEVLAVGDFEFQKKCLGKMHDVADGGRTVLFVSHNMAAVRSLCHSVCVLHEGGLVFRGDTEEGIHRYLVESHPEGTTAEVHLEGRDPLNPSMSAARLYAGGQVTGRFDMGSTLAFEVDYVSPYPLRHPRLGYVLNAEDGERLLGANNRFLPSKGPDVSASSGTIRCELGVVPLMAGRYTLSLWFGDYGRDHHIVLEALAFEVTERDVWGRGTLPPTGSSRLWWPSSFEIMPRVEAGVR